MIVTRLEQLDLAVEEALDREDLEAAEALCRCLLVLGRRGAWAEVIEHVSFELSNLAAVSL